MMHPLVRQMLDERMAADVETESIKHLDFDPAVVCEVVDSYGVPVCDQPAVWVVRCKVCTVTYLRCEPHRVDLLAWAAYAGLIRCSACKTMCRELFDLVDILPLGRAS